VAGTKDNRQRALESAGAQNRTEKRLNPQKIPMGDSFGLSRFRGGAAAPKR